MYRLLALVRKHAIAILLCLLWLIVWQMHLLNSWLELSPPEEVAAFILLLTATLWITEALPLYISSLGVLLLSVLLLHPLLDTSNVPKEVFYQAFFGDITLLFMGGFVLSALLNKYGIAVRIANRVIRRTGTRPSYFLLGIILIAAFLSMWMSNTATAAMMFAIVGPIVLVLPDTDPFTKALGLAIPFACNIGGLGTPIGTPPNAIAIEYLQQAGISISFAQWIGIGVPAMLILGALLWAILLKLYPAQQASIPIEQEKNTTPLSGKQYMVLALFLLTILGWLFSGQLAVTTGTVGLCLVIASFGLRLLDTRDFKNISWDILFMLGGGLCLGVGLQKSGLTATIAVAIPMGSPFWVILITLIILAACMTTFMSNTATANLLIPVAISLPNNELILAIAISLMCSTSMALPVSTPPNAIAFGSGLVGVPDIFKSGMIMTLLALIVIILMCILYVPLFI
ncbi:MAG: DASS family sodium-coupled anion symporter [Bacteroidota bacterium]